MHKLHRYISDGFHIGALGSTRRLCFEGLRCGYVPGFPVPKRKPVHIQVVSHGQAHGHMASSVFRSALLLPALMVLTWLKQLTKRP